MTQPSQPAPADLRRARAAGSREVYRQRARAEGRAQAERELTRDKRATPEGIKQASRKAGESPVLPILMILVGGWFMWFGVHYWRDKSTIWPTDPVKDVLQGKNPPVADRAPAVALEIGAAAQAGAQSTAGGLGTGALASGSMIAKDAEQYIGRKYVWGGASPVTGWDCSGFVNYVLCHDLKLNIPGFKGGSFDGSQHGGNVAAWLAWAGVTHHAFGFLSTIPTDQLPGGTAGAPNAQPGDLVCWGPNEHMGIAVSASKMVSAENPRDGTQESDIVGFFNTLPILLRLKEVSELAGSGAGGTPTQNQNTAALLAQPYGWSPTQDPVQWNALVQLWQGESSWDTTAKNPTSGAYGIPQALPGSKMATVAPDWMTNPATQIRWGLAYIEATYGSPQQALAKWESRSPHWY